MKANTLRGLGAILAIAGPLRPAPAQDPGVAPDAVPPRVARALEWLQSPLPERRERALRTLESAGAAAVPALSERLRDATAGDRCAEVFGQTLFFAPDDGFYSSLDSVEFAWPEPSGFGDLDLVSAPELRERRGELRRTYAAIDAANGHVLRLLFALSTCGEAAAPATDVMVRLLAHETLASDAAQVLIDIGPPAVPALLAAMRDRHRRHAAAQVLACLQVGRPAGLVLGPMVELLRSGDRRVRVAALEGIGRLGDVGDGDAAAAVAAAIRADDGRAQKQGAWALCRIGRAAVPEVRGLLRGDLDRPARAALLGAIRLLGPHAREVTAEVMALAGTGVAPVELADALAAAAPDTEHEERAFGLLVQKAQEGAMIGRAAAVHALGSFRGQAAAAAPLLAALVAQEGYLLRRLALETVTRLGPGARAAAPAVLAVIEHDGALVDRATLLGLVSAGVLDAEEARSEGAVAEWDRGLRCVAVCALGAIDPGSMPRQLEWLHDDALGWSAVAALVSIGPAAIPACVDLLDESVRGPLAAAALARLGDKGVEQLLVRMVDPDPQVVENVEGVLLWQAEGIEGPLVALLRRGNSRERDAAARVLAARDLSHLRRREADALLAATRDAPVERLRDLVTALETVDTDRVVRFLVQCTTHDDAEVRRRAVSGLARYQDVDRDDVCAALRKALADRAPEVRIAATEGLARSSGDDARCVEPLLEQARATLVEARAAALATLGVFRVGAERSLPALLDGLADPSGAVRVGALRGFAGLGPLARPHADRIVAQLRGEDASEELKHAVLSAVAAIRPELEAATDRVRERLYDGGFAVGLGGAAGGPGAAAPEMDDAGWAALRRDLQSERRFVIVRALQKVRQLGGAAAQLRDPVAALLAHDDEHVRRNAIDTLWWLVRAEAAPQILPCLGDPAAVVREAVLHNLQWVPATRAAAVFEPVLAAIDDPMLDVRLAAIAAAARLATSDAALQSRAEARFRALFTDADAAVVARASTALAGFTVLEPESIEALLDGLRHDDPAVQAAMATGVRAAGERASRAVPRLLELAARPHTDLRAACLHALARIAPGDVASMWLALEALQTDGAGGGPDVDAAAFAVLGV